MDIHSLRQPLGVCAGICPFNFPAMIPLWMFPIAVAAGNTYVMKPSEVDPGAANMLAAMAMEAGLPAGVLNVVQGTAEVVAAACSHPAIKAVSFVGSDRVGRIVHDVSTKHGKRCQANLAAKNHGVILPDADRRATVNALVGAAFGAAGQRCMALSAAVFVGDAKEWIPEVVEAAAQLQVNRGDLPGSDLGPLMSPAALEKAVGIVSRCEEGGATLLLDGRGAVVEGLPSGNWFGPTIIGDVSNSMECYTEEIFSPVLSVLTSPTLDAAIELCNANPYGNGAALFTRSGAAARKFAHEIDSGQVGINVPIPVALPMFSFSGSKKSMVGGPHFYGKQGVDFCTQTKTITSLWKEELAADSEKASGAMFTPGMKT